MKFFIYLLPFHLVNNLFGQITEKEQIIQLIEAETRLFAEASMSKVVEKYWIMDSKTYMNVTTTDGRKIHQDSLALVNSIQQHLSNPSEITKSEHHVRVKDSFAYAFHEQAMLDLKTRQTVYSHEVRILEKVNDVWKIHATSVHLFVH